MRSRPPQTLPLSGLCLVLVVNEKSEERVWEKQTKYFDLDSNITLFKYILESCEKLKIASDT